MSLQLELDGIELGDTSTVSTKYILIALILLLLPLPFSLVHPGGVLGLPSLSRVDGGGLSHLPV